MTRAHPENFRLRLATDWVRAGGIIAYPTEAVFGLGCDPADGEAVTRLLRVKQRPLSKGLILVASDWAQLQPWLQPLTAAQRRPLLDSWPGPVTWLVPAGADCPVWLTGAHDTLAVRVTAHPLVRALCHRLGHALVSTSANISQHPPARSVLEVQLRLLQQIDCLLPGPLGGLSQPTTIRDLATGRTLRP